MNEHRVYSRLPQDLFDKLERLRFHLNMSRSEMLFIIVGWQLHQYSLDDMALLAAESRKALPPLLNTEEVN